MENDVLTLESHHRAASEELATVQDDLEIQIAAHRGAGAALERTCSPPSSHHCDQQLVSGGTVCAYHQQEVDGSHTSLLSPRAEHLVSESESTASPHSALTLGGHFQPRSPSQAAALAGTVGEEAVVAISSEVVAQIKALLEINTISREQFMNIYDEYVSEREQQRQAQLSRFSMAHAQAKAQAAAMLNSSSIVAAAVSSVSNNNNHTISASTINSRQHVMHTSNGKNDEEDASSPLLSNAPTQKDHLNALSGSHNVELVDIAGNGTTSMEMMDDANCTENNETTTGEEENAVTIGGTPIIMDGEDEENSGGVDVGVGVGGDGSQVGKMQSLVRTALESYETASPVISEIGQKRKHFTLEEELRLQPSPFAQQLLE